jgi:hypothetical protein
LSLLVAASAFEQRANKFFSKLGKSVAQILVGFNAVCGNEALKNSTM